MTDRRTEEEAGEARQTAESDARHNVAAHRAQPVTEPASLCWRVTSTLLEVDVSLLRSVLFDELCGWGPGRTEPEQELRV